ncbi:MAG: ATP-binding protein [Cyanobacteria bacterium P01_G01_bin.54]
MKIKIKFLLSSALVIGVIIASFGGTTIVGKHLEEQFDKRDDITDEALEIVADLEVKVRDEASALKNHVLLDTSTNDMTHFREQKAMVLSDLATLSTLLPASSELTALKAHHQQLFMLASELQLNNANLVTIKNYIHDIDNSSHNIDTTLNKIAENLTAQEEKNDEYFERLLFWLVVARYSSLGVAIFIVLIQFKTVFSPMAASIKTLEAKVKAMGSGQWEQRVEIQTSDEIEALAQEFNTMAEQLKELYRSLEQKVSDRTTELSQTNSRLTETLQQLKKAQGQLVQQEKMSSLGQLVAGVAHEINNPVGFILGNLTHTASYTHDLLSLVTCYEQHYPQPHPEILTLAQEIDLDYLKADLTEALSSMKLGTDRICDIVSSLRTFSRLDEADQKEAQIHEGIDSTLVIVQSRLRAQPERPEIQVHKTYGNLPPIYCYPGQLNQVFMNLLTNAIDALEDHYSAQSASGSVHTPLEIGIHTRKVSGAEMDTVLPNQTDPNIMCSQDAWLEIRVTDNGRGIPQTVVDKIFDPFFTTKKVGKGTGLGLSISYQIIVDQHGGELRCESTPGQGAQFIIMLPMAKASVVQNATLASV